MKDTLALWKNIISDPSLYERYSAYMKEVDEKVHAFLELKTEVLRNSTDPSIKTDNPLTGLPFAVKDNIAVEGFKLSCGSRMLESHLSPYSASAVQKLQEAGAIVIGKTNLDEFGMGSSTDNSALALTNNPWDLERVAGGSSGGSAVAVATGMVPFAIGSDTGGSIRQPASFCGIYGLKPTYGLVSRYGLVAYASSLEVIGVLSRNIDLVEAVFKCMRGQDEMDHSSLDYISPEREEEPKKIGIIREELCLQTEVEESYKKTVQRLEDSGFTLEEITIDHLDYVVPAYYTIATAEASANLARFNGVRYGHRPEYSENPDELVRMSRDEGFGDEVKMRILLGTFVLRSGFQEQYYQKAQKIRTALRMDFENAFEKVDLIMTPTFPVSAFKHGDSTMDAFQQKLADRYTSTANLAGIPALSFPAGIENGLPVGMQFLAPPFAEDRLFQAARAFEKGRSIPYPPGFEPSWLTERSR